MKYIFNHNDCNKLTKSDEKGIYFIQNLTATSFFFQGSRIGSENIIFKDMDSISVNSNISYEVLNDTLEIIHPICNAYENDQAELKHTAISCSKC